MMVESEMEVTQNSLSSSCRFTREQLALLEDRDQTISDLQFNLDERAAELEEVRMVYYCIVSSFVVHGCSYNVLYSCHTSGVFSYKLQLYYVYVPAQIKFTPSQSIYTTVVCSFMMRWHTFYLHMKHCVVFF